MKLVKRILITGASKGIGREIAKQLLFEGNDVIGTSRNPDKVPDKLKGLQYVQLELADKDSIRKCFEEVSSVDILINNAGQSQLGSVEEISIEKFEELYRINLFGMIYLTKLFLPDMRLKREGAIINIGSLGGRFALPYFSSYSSSKSAVQAYTQSLRYEMIPFGIKVVLIEPSDIKTSISPEFFSVPDSEYQVIASKVRTALWESMSKAHPPEVVARKICSVLNKRSPKPTYAIGGSAPLLVFIRRFMPEKLVETIVRRRYGI